MSIGVSPHFFWGYTLTFFISPAQAEVCAGDYIVNLNNSSGDIAALSGCTEIAGNLIIDELTLMNYMKSTT